MIRSTDRNINTFEMVIGVLQGKHQNHVYLYSNYTYFERQ